MNFVTCRELERGGGSVPEAIKVRGEYRICNADNGSHRTMIL